MERIDFEAIRQAPLLTSQEAAKLLNVSLRTLWSMTKPRGPIPFVPMAKRLVRYSPAAIQSWIEQQQAGLGSVA